MRPCHQPMKRNTELPSKFRDKEERCIVYIYGKYYIGTAKSAVKHLAPSKPPNQQITGKEGKGKKRNDSVMAVE